MWQEQSSLWRVRTSLDTCPLLMTFQALWRLVSMPSSAVHFASALCTELTRAPFCRVCRNGHAFTEVWTPSLTCRPVVFGSYSLSKAGAQVCAC